MIGRPWGPWEIPTWARRRGADVMMHFESMHTAVRIIGDDQPKVLPNLRKRVVKGTGFVVQVQSEMHPSVYYPYVVTAAHVLEEQQKVEIELPIPRPAGGTYSPVVLSDWRQPLPHVDLAISSFEDASGEHKAVYAIDEKDILPNRLVQKLSLAGDVAYVGILTPQDRPMVRTGTIGAIDQENLDLESGYDYTAHLVDCRSYGGFSGSPVFVGIAKPGLRQDAEAGGVPLGEMAYFAFLCGMFTEHLTDKKHWASSRYGVGVMVRSIEIREALMSERLRKERAELDKKARDADPEGPSFHTARSNASESEFERFQDLTQKLVNVPKKELDEKRKDES
jgi:trypsin-like peptidase